MVPKYLVTLYRLVHDFLITELYHFMPFSCACNVYQIRGCVFFQSGYGTGERWVKRSLHNNIIMKESQEISCIQVDQK